MTGAILNAAGILVGGLIGLVRKRQPSATTQAFFKTVLGVFIMFYGLQLAWRSVNGPFLLILKQITIVLLAMILGRLTGRLLGLQKASNQLGHFARQKIQESTPGSPRVLITGLVVCAILFCASPLGILGAIQDGLSGFFYPQAVKGMMDALATMGLASLFGAGAMLAALPVLLFQGAITMACNLYLEPFLRLHGLVDIVNATGGLLVCFIGLVIFEVKRVALADYLPSLAFAPLIAWFWK